MIDKMPYLASLDGSLREGIERAAKSLKMDEQEFINYAVRVAVIQTLAAKTLKPEIKS